MQVEGRVSVRLVGGWAASDAPAVEFGPIVYRLGRHSFKVQRRVRFPLGLLESAVAPGPALR